MRQLHTHLILLTALGCGGNLGPAQHSGAATSDSDYGGSYAGEAEAAAVATASASVRTGADSVPMGAIAGAPAAPEPMAEMDAAGAVTATTTTTTTVTVHVDTPTPPPIVDAPSIEPVVVQQPPARLLTAATVSDHDRQDNYHDYLARHTSEANHFGLDMRERVRVRIVDAHGAPVGGAIVRVTDGRLRVEAQTHADGVVDIHPRLSGLGDVLRVDAYAHNEQLTGQVDMRQTDEGYLRLQLRHNTAPRARVLELAFAIDVTGSMEDELRYVNNEIADIVQRVRSQSQEVRVRVGAVFYRDRTDAVPLQRIQFTEDVASFAAAMQSVRASGGGDYPEDMNAGLQTALSGLTWGSDATASKVLVVIADAPPQRYGTQFDHRHAIATAVQSGIRILPVAASGADRKVEYLFRAMGAATSTPYVYLTDDSGIGGRHMEADTDRVAVEYFNDVLTRLLITDLAGEGMHETAGFEQ